MSWYHTEGKEQDVVVSTRVRFARNLENIPFTSRMDAATAEALIEKTDPLLTAGGFVKTDFRSVSRAQAYALMEKHYISPAFIKVSLPHALYLNDPCHLSVMLCEEDHLRLQCILPGLALNEAYEGARRVDELLDGSLPYAYDAEGRWGYLTHCPTNAGTAMRASAMLFLPALTHAGQMESLATQLALSGMTVRGKWGEGTGTSGYLYQISNRITLGATEDELLAGLSEAVEMICARERQLRGSIKGEALDKLTDRVWRALGLLKYARALSLGEFISLLSDLRLGVAMGLLDGPSLHELTSLLIEAMPASLALTSSANPASDRELDIARGALVRKALKEIT
ncbi:MAG: ATP--guanido phosphotransferase [Clostridia bacterium]|nr:ATP--guanido phosphotransferase [Clostridia bacterium]